ncbi:hypothetical protein [Streptomyces iranensis]|nr:hypothetical protein [Streptomyces iranensis]MBP2059923.1 hypothetical protein [Streptomyces iranensis]
MDGQLGLGVGVLFDGGDTAGRGAAADLWQGTAVQGDHSVQVAVAAMRSARPSESRRAFRRSRRHGRSHRTR